MRLEGNGRKISLASRRAPYINVMIPLVPSIHFIPSTSPISTNGTRGTASTNASKRRKEFFICAKWVIT
jgi:hypothetical protein